MLNIMQKLKSVFLGVSLFLVTAAITAEEQKQPDGYIDIEATQVAIGIGIGWGTGELQFANQRYPIKLKGLSLVGAGATISKITGNVYNLTKVEDIAGNYTVGGAGGTLGKGAGTAKMKNEKGVVIDMWLTGKGLNVAIGGGGITIELVK